MSVNKSVRNVVRSSSIIEGDETEEEEMIAINERSNRDVGVYIAGREKQKGKGRKVESFNDSKLDRDVKALFSQNLKQSNRVLK